MDREARGKALVELKAFPRGGANNSARNRAPERLALQVRRGLREGGGQLHDALSLLMLSRAEHNRHSRLDPRRV